MKGPLVYLLQLLLSFSFPTAIFDQYYKNQPTDFLRKILRPCVPEYFIAVHPIVPFRPTLPFPVYVWGQKGKTEGERFRGVGHTIRVRFVACPFPRYAIFQREEFLRSIWNLHAILTHSTFRHTRKWIYRECECTRWIEKISLRFVTFWYRQKFAINHDNI